MANIRCYCSRSTAPHRHSRPRGCPRIRVRAAEVATRKKATRKKATRKKAIRLKPRRTRLLSIQDAEQTSEEEALGLIKERLDVVIEGVEATQQRVSAAHEQLEALEEEVDQEYDELTALLGDVEGRLDGLEEESS